MSISGRHRSPLLRESPDLPKDFYSFQSAAQPGGALFCLPPSKVIYQLYPTANVFCAIDIAVYKTAISSLFSHVVCNIMPSISQQQKANRHGDRCHGGSLLHFFLRAPIVRVHIQYTRTGAPCKRYLLYRCDMFFVWLTLPCGRPRFPHRGPGRCPRPDQDAGGRFHHHPSPVPAGHRIRSRTPPGAGQNQRLPSSRPRQRR